MSRENRFVSKHPSPENPWKTISSRMVYENPWIRIQENQVIRPDGSPGIYGVVRTHLAVGVVALSSDNEVFLVGQYRYPIDRYSWEIIEGGATIEEGGLQGAQRELEEEAGIVASHWEQLGAEVHLSNCITDEVALLYLARDLHFGEPSPEPVEVLQLRRIPLEAALEMVENGEITDAMSIIALSRVAALLKRSHSSKRQRS